MLFGRSFGEGLEPVGNMGYTMLHSPFLHAAGHAVGRFAVKGLATLDAGKQGLEAVGIQILAHFLAVEHQFAKIIGSLACGDFCRDYLPLEGFFDQIESVHNQYC